MGEDYAHPRAIYHSRIQEYLEDRMDPYDAESGCNFVYNGREMRRLEETIERENALLAEIDETIEYMLDTVSGSAAKGKKIIGIVCIHSRKQ